MFTLRNMKDALSQIIDPGDYFSGVGHGHLPMPHNILLYVRRTKNMLQQEALQNRSHHRVVLSFNLETTGSVHVNNLALPFHPEQALLILPFQFHHFSHLESMNLKWLFCTFEMEPYTFLEPLRNQVVNISKTTQKVRKELAQTWLQCNTELQEYQLQIILMRLLILLREDRQQTTTDLPPDSEENLLRTVNRLLSEWRGRPILVSDLADAMGYSTSRLRILFKRTAGVSVGTYIQNYRINRAMALLRTTDLPITDLAEEAGFGSPQAFSRIFKKASGQTPRDYRRLL